MTDVHKFENRDKPIRVGSRVLLVNSDGDANIAVVTALREYPKLEVRVQTRLNPAEAIHRVVTSSDLLPFEDEDKL